MIELTVDVGVLMSGSGLGDPENHAGSKELMRKMKLDQHAFLAMDKVGRIEAQYSQKMVFGTEGHAWVYHMATRGKVRKYEWKQFNRGTRTKLREAHFDPEDYKYVRTACASEGKNLVSHDPDYSTTVRSILKKRDGVDVLSGEEATALI